MSQKASNLRTLSRHGILIPRGFSLDGTHYQEAIAPFANRIAQALPDSQRVAEIFGSLSIPERTVRRVEEGLASLHAAASYAVRSSGCVVTKGRSVLEDSSTTSLAGQFESFLQVPRDSVLQAIRGCWASLFNRRSVELFAADSSYVSGSSMSVVIQEMLPAVASAVMMTMDPLGAGDVGGIELTLGPCEAIVSGICSPDEVTFSRIGGTILRTAVGRKEFKIEYGVYQDRAGNVRQVPVQPEEQAAFCVASEVVASLIRIGCQIEVIFHKPQDIEAVITPSNQVVITQTRAITGLVEDSVPFELPLAG